MHEWRQLSVSDLIVMIGKPVVAGARVTAELILDKLAGEQLYIQRVGRCHANSSDRGAISFLFLVV